MLEEKLVEEKKESFQGKVDKKEDKKEDMKKDKKDDRKNVLSKIITICFTRKTFINRIHFINIYYVF